MLSRADLVRTDVSEELSSSIIKVTRIGEVGTSAVTRNRRTLRYAPIFVNLMIGEVSSTKTSVLTRATQRNVPEDATLHFKKSSVTFVDTPRMFMYVCMYVFMYAYVHVCM
jgi:hypothetical protein